MISLLLALLAAAPRPPLACPAGTEHRGAQPMEGFEEYCVELQLDGKERREGPAVRYYDDGTVWVECGYHEGKLRGPYVERFRGGKIAREGPYEAGIRVGTWRFYFEDGTLQEESGWRDGSPHGSVATYWPNGKLRTKGRHCRGAQCGVWRSFDEAGKVLGTVEYGEQRDEP